MKKLRTLTSLICIPVLLASGCAQQPSPTAPQTELQPFASSPPAPGELNADSLFDLLTAELAGKQGRFDLALKRYLTQAEVTGDAAVAERATRIAQFLRDPEKVLQASQLWSRIEPEALEPLHIRANILLHEGQFEAAEPLLEQVLDQGGDEALAMITGQADDMPPEVARRYYALLTRLGADMPDRLDYLLARVMLLQRLGEVDTAAKLLDQELTREPTQAELALQRAELHRRQGEPLKGLALVEKAMAENPAHPRLPAVRAQLLLLSGQHEAGWQAIKRVLAQEDSDPQLQFYFALLLLENEQPERSRMLLEQLLERHPENPEPHFYLGVIAQQQGHRKQAIDHYLQVEEGPNAVQAFNRALSLYDQPQQAADVEMLIEDTVARHPERRETLTILYAEWLQRQDLIDTANEVLTDAIEQLPASADLLYTRAMITPAGQSDAMLRDLEQAYTLEPESAMIQNALGYTLTLYAPEQLERAHTLISRALEQSPEDPAILDSMGWVLFKLGRTEEALNFLQRAHDAYPDPEVLGHLVQVLWELGEREQARNMLDKGLEQTPDNLHLLEAADAIKDTQ
ncbi:tetratricopeptide repeat protein [Marinobacterium sp. AK62]|uniref:Tetratricopeptide repeat protein n=1 Tax=Marinobacterium alkalitolerans TaxID=1542925 RepID=A0ABS3Z8B7_9GAMM|nr:tetratricopeptide repeat protein [Marinobacterium alkalitolerans]MBP0047927.1 tetratricopeptide repeat protein [Marinobacterium alkalitolerans]